MASSYFSIPSFSRAQKNKEELEKTNPRSPVLNDEDEKFLERHMSMDDAAGSKSKEDQNDEKEDTTATKITDDRKTEEASKDEAAAAEASQVVVPDTTTENKADADDPPEQAPEASSYPAQSKSKKPKGKDMELPSQEDAEAATKGFASQAAQDAQKSGNSSGEAGEKRTWVSYLPTVGTSTKKSDSTSTDKAGESAGRAESSGKTWTEYASSYIPSTTSLKSRKDKDSNPDPVLKPDGTIDEAATAAKQEREVSVLLDNLNMSAINNRVFAFSAETQKIYERFAQVLKDVISGAPTAYEDMDKLMREAGPKLEEQFNSMPPFVQTLVKNLPMKLGPGLMAAASEKSTSTGGDDLKAKMQSASAGTAAGPAAPAPSPQEGEQAAKKNKRRVPGMKGLVSQQGLVATMLKNVVTFLQTRFPLLASTTNVVMSLAVFILMFVFWYCHKRGREVRLAQEAEGKEGEVDAEGEEEEDLEIEASDEDGDEENAEEKEDAAEISKGGEEDSNTSEKQNALNQPEPKEVPLPESSKT